MSKTISLILFTFFTFLFSCEQQNKNISRDITFKTNKIDFSGFEELTRDSKSVIKDVQFIQLETNEKSLIGEVTKVLATDENILILDARRAKSVFIFNHFGKYVRKIGNEGNGPQEYSFLADMDLDSGGNLHLLDLRKSQVLEFLIDGKFVSEQKFGFMTYKFATLKNGSYLFDQGTRDNSRFKDEVDLDYKLITWNPTLQKLNKFLEYTDVYDSPSYILPNTHNVYRSGNKLNYVKPYEYNIYEPTSESKVVSTHYIDFGEHEVPKAFYSNTKKPIDVIRSLRNTDLVYNIINVYETSKYLCFNFFVGSIMHWGALSKKDNSIYVRNLSEMSLKDYPFLMCPSAVHNDEFITIIRPEYLPYLSEKYGYDELKEIGLSILTEHKPDMNPILVKWSLKDSF